MRIYSSITIWFFQVQCTVIETKQLSFSLKKCVLATYVSNSFRSYSIEFNESWLTLPLTLLQTAGKVMYTYLRVHNVKCLNSNVCTWLSVQIVKYESWGEIIMFYKFFICFSFCFQRIDRLNVYSGKHFYWKNNYDKLHF